MNSSNVFFGRHRSPVPSELTTTFTPVQIARYYGIPANLKGKGQSIAILDFGASFDQDSINTYFENTLGMKPPNVIVEELPGQLSNGSPVEVYMDIEIVGAIAPAAQIVVYRAPNAPASFAQAITAAATDKHNNSVISISWGMSEAYWESADIEAVDKALALAKKNKVTVCAATGDGGSSDYMLGSRAFPNPDEKAHVNFPASHPFVLACGGTEFVGEHNKIEGEQVWNNSDRPLSGGATGGGVSNLYAPPSYQTTAKINIRSANKGARKGRVLPDVSAVAAFSSYDIRVGDQEGPGGGTSAATPLWAAMIALLNQKLKTRLGFFNPLLYKTARSQQGFNDITVGNNQPSANYPGYTAKVGFDACTGWGSPKFKALVQGLT
ncbi:MAG: S53 family peptidase [Bacteroidota bacterium]